MDYRPLGQSGTVVSALALGTVTFGEESDEQTSFAMLDRYAEAGGIFLDTGDVYAGGRSEEIIGAWLRARSTLRDQIVIATKGRFPTGSGPNDLGSSKRHLTRALDASLLRLGVEQIDLYQLHAWDPITPLDETLRFLDDAVSAGKIGRYGVSNFTAWQLTKAVHVAHGHGWQAPVTTQLQYNLLVRGIEAEIVPAAADAGVGILVWSPLAGGWLTGKYERGVAPTGSTRYAENPTRGIQSWQDRDSSEHTWRVIDALKVVAEDRGTTPGRIALAWLLQKHAVTSVIIGARTIEQLDESLSVTAMNLSGDELAYLDDRSEPRFESYPYGAAGQEQRQRKLAGGR